MTRAVNFGDDEVISTYVTWATVTVCMGQIDHDELKGQYKLKYTIQINTTTWQWVVLNILVTLTSSS